MISVGRDERLVHSHISSALRSEQLVSLLSLNITSNGSVHITMPDIDNNYVHALYQEKHLPSSSSSLTKCYAYETMRKFLSWNQMIKGKSILGIYSEGLLDQSIENFHRFARRWILGTGGKSPMDLAQICHVNGNVAKELHRPDLQATWQMIEMLFANQDISLESSKNSRSLTKSQHISDPFTGSHRQHYFGKKLTSAEKQRQEGQVTEESKSHDGKVFANAKLGNDEKRIYFIFHQLLFRYD